MTRRTRGPWGADGYFLAALVVGLIGGLPVAFTSGDATVVNVALYVTGPVFLVFMLIGAVAKGVEAGLRAVRNDD